MINRLVLVVSIIFCLGVSTAYAASLSLKIQCPATATVGYTFQVTSNVVNNSGADVTVANALVSLIGNESWSVMGLGLTGPFMQSVGNVTVPNGYSGAGATLTAPSATAVVPQFLSGKAAMLAVILLDGNGKSLGSDSCIVNVVPYLP